MAHSISVAFRVEASIEIGTGHVMRCLTLADALRKLGAACCFICRPHAGHLLDLIAQRGYQTLALPALRQNTTMPQDGLAHSHWLGTDWTSDAAETREVLRNAIVDWLVVDHYALDAQWEQALRINCKRLMVIDDLADRTHDCDLLLDQNLGRTTEDYKSITSAHVTKLIGPQFALLRPEFAELRQASLARRTQPELKRLLITMGGVDKDNATGRVLDALKACPLPHELQITVVMGPYAPWLQQVQARAEQMPWATQVHIGTSHMAQLMVDSDLAIGAAGGTAWERCCLGLPSFVLVQAENQRAGATALQATGAVLAMQNASEIQNPFQCSLSPCHMRILLQNLSKAAERVTDGLGATRVAQQLVADHA